MQKKMRRYQCSVCGYVYDPMKGEPAERVGMETPWALVNNSFHCPVCGQGKAAFQQICTAEFPGKAGL